MEWKVQFGSPPGPASSTPAPKITDYSLLITITNVPWRRAISLSLGTIKIQGFKPSEWTKE